MKFLLAIICFWVFLSIPSFAAGPAPVTLSGTDPDDFIVQISGVSGTKFSLEVIAPRDSITEFALCKAVAQAQKQGAESMSLGDPKFSAPPKIAPGTRNQIPDDWADLKATVWLTNPNPSGSPAFSVAGKALACNHTWDWFRNAAPASAASDPAPQAIKSVEFKGQTVASPAVVNSVFANIMRVSSDRLHCRSATQITQEMMPATYKPMGETFDDPAKTIFEKWTVTLCGRDAPFLIGFWPAADGGTMFRVVFPFPPTTR